MAIRRITRRQFVATLGSAAAWPVVARAQQPTMPVIGFLGISSRENMGNGVLLDFKRGLAETGYVEGQNVTIEYRWAEDGPARQESFNAHSNFGRTNFGSHPNGWSS